MRDAGILFLIVGASTMGFVVLAALFEYVICPVAERIWEAMKDGL